MVRKDLDNEYFNWIYQLVCTDRCSGKVSYQKLLRHLHSVEFTYTIDMDGNRAEDGVNLRYRFGYETGHRDPVIATLLDNKPCSVLEMMVALAIRCEEHIMENSELGDRTSQWFWKMISSLSLKSMTDTRYDREHVDNVIRRFLNREYKRNGEGGLFTIEHCDQDMRGIEIWYQMCWYLNSIL